MSGMQSIMKEWNRHLLYENIQNLKTNPNQAQKFVKRISQTSDRNELQDVLTVLMSDPQIRQAAELIATLEDEVEEEREETQQTDAPKTAMPTEGILDDFDLAVGQTAFKYTQSPTFQKILKIRNSFAGKLNVGAHLVVVFANIKKRDYVLKEGNYI